jgi:nucleoside triphosphate diphosphatase
MPTPGERFDELVRIMARLRGPEGCPWDREQTLTSLRPFLLEETYEALEALDRGDLQSLREELGDLLFEIVFLARIAEEGGHFSITDAAAEVGAKLVRRHPHVFGDDARLKTAEEVRGKWEEIKAAERGEGAEEAKGAKGGKGAEGAKGGKTLLGGVPATLPALLRAYEYGSRAAAVGFDWARASDVIDKIEEEIRELRDARSDGVKVHEAERARRVEEEMGDLLFAIANLSRKLGVEPEAALRRANDKFRARFTALEARIVGRGEKLQDKSLDELEVEWQEVKAERS